MYGGTCQWLLIAIFHIQLSVLAESMGMNVIYYDINPVMPLGNSTAMSNLDELLKKVKLVIHTLSFLWSFLLRAVILAHILCFLITFTFVILMRIRFDIHSIGRFRDIARARNSTHEEHDHKATVAIDAQGLLFIERVARYRCEHSRPGRGFEGRSLGRCLHRCISDWTCGQFWRLDQSVWRVSCW